jgi:hypothetical protein
MLKVLRETPIGQSFTMSSPVPGIDDDFGQVVVLEDGKDGDWFRVGLYWQGVSLGEFTIEKTGSSVAMEAL